MCWFMTIISAPTLSLLGERDVVLILTPGQIVTTFFLIRPLEMTRYLKENAQTFPLFVPLLRD